MNTYKQRSLDSSMVLCYILYSFTIILPTSGFSLRNCLVEAPFNYSGDLTIFCYKMGFLTVPSKLPSSVVKLVISFNYISEIKEGDLSSLTRLMYLNVSNNHISHIHEGAFRNSGNLEELNLSRNRLRNVSGSWLWGLHKLSVLRLDGNTIEHIEPKVFTMLEHLQVLNLTNNKLQSMEKLQLAFTSTTLHELYVGMNDFVIFKSSNLSTTALKMLDLSGNPLTKFQIAENIFPALEYLDLSYCGHRGHLDWLIQNVTMLKSVTTLKLDGVHISGDTIAAILGTFKATLNKLRMNNITTIKPEHLFDDACSDALKAVHFGENNISYLTKHMIMPCSLLQQLDLSSNAIHHISQDTFTNFTQLVSLHLQHNRITSLNGAFKGIPVLELLDLSTNKIEKLTCSDFDQLVNLKKLYLYSNKIASVSACLFKDLRNLHDLKLGTNRLMTVTKSFSEVLPNLQYLQLRNNKISTIHRGTFGNLSSLKALDVVDNQISEIEENAFAGLTNLTWLSIASNKLTENTIKNPNIFSGLFKLQELNLYSNYLSFDTQHLQFPPFVHLKSLKTLAINSQRHHGLNFFPSNLLEGLKSLKVFYAGNLNIRYLLPNTFNYTPNLSHLDLTRNMLDNSSLSPQVFHPIPKLTTLILSRSRLQSLDFLIKANLSRLSILRASGNQISSVNKTLIKSIPKLQVLDLQNNTFPCDCTSAWFIDWSLKYNLTQVLYLNQYICHYPSAMRKKSLVDFNTESCMVDYDFICFLCSSLVVLFTVAASFIYNFLKWHLVYTYYLFLALLHDRKRKQRTQQQQFGFQYDAFISYNVHDEPWVMEELLPNLEGKQGWRLCLHHRDFQPGKSITDNIVDGIYNSRKTICVITHNYLRSNWCTQEIQVARFRLFDERKDVLILIFLEDIPTRYISPYYQMKKLVKKQTYLRWPKAGDDTRVFWQKVNMAMETKETPDEERRDLSGHDNGC